MSSKVAPKSKTSQVAQIIYKPVNVINQKIIEILQDKKVVTYDELANELGIDPSNIGKRIRKLQSEGLFIKYKQDNKMIIKWIGGVPALEQELMSSTNKHVTASLLAENYDSMITNAFSVFSLLFENSYWEVIMNLKEGLTDVELSQRIGDSINLDSIRRILVTCDAHNLIKLNRIREPAENDMIKLFEPLYRVDMVNKEFFNYMVIIRGLASAMQYRMENKKTSGYSHPYDPLLKINIESYSNFRDIVFSKTSVEEQNILSKVLLNYDCKNDIERIFRDYNWRGTNKELKNINIDSSSNYILLTDNFAESVRESMVKRVK